MTKKVIVFIFITILIVIVGIKYKPHQDIEILDSYEVFYNDKEYNLYNNYDYYLVFDEYKLDSNNFRQILSFFDTYKNQIIEVYPDINPLYNKVLKDINKINYYGKNIDEGLSNIYKEYINILEKNHLYEELDKVYTYGIRINKIKINTSLNILNIFINKYKGINYYI